MELVLEKSERMREPLLRDVVGNDDDNDNDDGDDSSLTGLNSTRGSAKGRNSKQPSDDKSEDKDGANDINIYAVLSFITPFWVLTISCLVVYGCVLPFNNIASTLLLERDYFMAQPNDACALTNDAPGA